LHLIGRSPGKRTVNTEPLPGSLTTVSSPPHHARELAGDRKAEPRPAVAARGQGIGLGEILKQFRLLFGGQADAGIGSCAMRVRTSLRKIRVVTVRF
jgi:hypothetical protein